VNYAEIKALAAERGCSVKDLIALAPCNDPFYVGMPADIARAEWFAEQWRKFDVSYGVHLRRIHYLFMSQERAQAVRLPNGDPYINSLKCWFEIQAASKAARYLDLVPIGAFEDRRNPPAKIYESTSHGLVELMPVDAYFSINVPGTIRPHLRITNVVHRPRYHLEVWCEKSTMDDVLVPLCAQHRANLVTGLGELTTTACNLVVRRIVQAERAARIFYVSDFDPGGQSMPVAVARKVEFLAQRHADLDVRLYPIVLTEQQVVEFALPRVPIKKSEKRRTNFEKAYGEGAVELDALEALYPGELGRIVGEHLARYRDPEIGRKVERTRKRLNGIADRAVAKIVAKYHDQLEEAEDALLAMRDEARDWEAKYEGLETAMRAELAAAAQHMADHAEPPEECEAEELDEPLLDTGRTYLEQLEFYRRFQKRDGTARP
jgi:hypothetical protein